jgi:signal transduction histidine kinase
VTHWRSARARLTALYTALFAAGGIILVAVTYLLVAHVGHTSTKGGSSPLPTDFLASCSQLQKASLTAAELANLKAKCSAAYTKGVTAGVTTGQTHTLNHLLVYSIVTLVGVTALSALAGWVLAGRILRPVHQLTVTARSASERTLSTRMEVRGPRDELRELAETFDEMLARLDAAFSSQQRFIANASHELRTPLTVMRISIDVVLAKAQPTIPELVAMSHDIRREIDHAEHLIEALLTLARADRQLTKAEPIDLATVAENALDTLNLSDLTLETELEPASMRGDPILIERLITNLIDNAIRYNTPAGTIHLVTASQARHAEFRVVNTGPVVPLDAVPGLLQPFTRLNDRTSHQGHGLGLALVSSIATQHHATVALYPNPGGGLDVSVRFPTAS